MNPNDGTEYDEEYMIVVDGDYQAEGTECVTVSSIGPPDSEGSFTFDLFNADNNYGEDDYEYQQLTWRDIRGVGPSPDGPPYGSLGCLQVIRGAFGTNPKPLFKGDKFEASLPISQYLGFYTGPGMGQSILVDSGDVVNEFFGDYKELFKCQKTCLASSTQEGESCDEPAGS